MKPHYTDLAYLHFSPTMIACYDSLFEVGEAVASTIASRLHLHRSGIYRALITLEAAGFVRSIKTDLGPTYYFALPLNHALAAHHALQRTQLNAVIMQQQARRAVVAPRRLYISELQTSGRRPDYTG